MNSNASAFEVSRDSEVVKGVAVLLSLALLGAGVGTVAATGTEAGVGYAIADGLGFGGFGTAVTSGFFAGAGGDFATPPCGW